jgi:hypothetical protein
MDYLQFSLFMVTMVSFFVMARNDHRSMLNLIVSIKDEMKDFHGRLCAIEERTKNKKAGE